MGNTDKERVIRYVSDACALTEPDIRAETELSALSLDSLSFVELIVNLESEFEIEFEDEELNIYDYSTVDDIILLVRRKINAGKKSA